MTHNPSTDRVYRMDRKIRAKWLRALRGGKIKQARGKLIDAEGRMCCIGVLGRICGMSDHNLAMHAGSIWGTGLEPILEELPIREELEHLADMNDGQFVGKKRRGAKSFKQIAAWIEKKL